MEYAYACADLIISRAGATTVAEIIAKGIPCILVPYPYATANHQMMNARVIADAGGGIVIMNDNLNGEVLADKLIELFRNEEKLENMKVNMKKLHSADNTYSFFMELIKELTHQVQ